MKRSFCIGVDIATQSIKLSVLQIDFQDGVITSIQLAKEVNFVFATEKLFAHQNETTHEVVVDPQYCFENGIHTILQQIDSQILKNCVVLSGSAQQHGSVYWCWNKNGTIEYLCKSPIWMDSSTQLICDELNSSLSENYLQQQTGSIAYARFTLSQILKRKDLLVNQTNPFHISLISSFLTSLLVGKLVPIDYGDGSGMNMLNIHTLQWDEFILEKVFKNWYPKLIEKLGGQPISANTLYSLENTSLLHKFGIHSFCKIQQFSGDNLNSAVYTLREENDICISLGSSHVLFGFSKEFFQETKEGHTFLNALYDLEHGNTAAKYFNLIVFKNGSIVRDNLCKQYSNNNQLDWEWFNTMLDAIPVGNEGRIGFYFTFPEITPVTKKSGVFRFDSKNQLINSFEDVKFEIRALIESQILALKLHGKRKGLVNITKIIVTGGASRNKHICQVIANVFQCPVYYSTQTSSASIGAAIRGLLALYPNLTREQVYKLIEKDESMCFQLAALPQKEYLTLYEGMLSRYEYLEQLVCDELS